MVSEKDKREEKLLKAIFLSKEIFQMMDNWETKENRWNSKVSQDRAKYHNNYKMIYTKKRP
jgi:hypothetical protein